MKWAATRTTGFDGDMKKITNLILQVQLQINDIYD